MSEPMRNGRQFGEALRQLANELDKLPEQMVFDSGRLYAAFDNKRIAVTLIQRGYKEDGWPDEPVQKVTLEVPVGVRP